MQGCSDDSMAFPENFRRRRQGATAGTTRWISPDCMTAACPEKNFLTEVIFCA
jgi:hypothetical protein